MSRFPFSRILLLAGPCSLLLVLLAAPCLAQSEVPLAAADASPMGGDWQADAGRDALASGLPGLAETIFRQVAEDTSAPQALRQEAWLELAAALAFQEKYVAAEDALAQVQAPYPGRYYLWQGFLFYQRGQVIGLEQAVQALIDLGPEAIAANQQPWFFLLQGLLYQAQGKAQAAAAAFETSRQLAASPVQQAYLESFRLSGRLLGEPLDDNELLELKERTEENRGTRLGLGFARQYAIALHQRGQTDEALAVLREELTLLTAEQTAEEAQVQLLIGIIAGPETGRGQRALLQVLQSGASRLWQQVALYEIARHQPVASEETRTAFSEALDLLVDERQNTQLRAELLLLRAWLSRERGDPEAARADAELLLEEYPGSALRVEALYLLAYLAWNAEPPRYRRAADFLARLRDSLPPGNRWARMARLMADAFFLNGDYATAADAYAAAAEQDTERRPRLRYQQVLAELRAGRLERALTVLQTSENDPWTTEMRWQAEWNYAYTCQQQGALDAALERCQMLLDSPPSDVPTSLRLRFLWLRAHLALRLERFPEALRVSRECQLALASASDLSREEAELLQSHAGLLEAQALLKLGRAEAALQTLTRLREDFPGSDPAVQAYFEEAHFYAAEYRLAEAQRLLRTLADTYPEHPSAPTALLEAALLADQQGLDRTQQEALDILRRFLELYPEHALAFRARLLQGHIARKLNRFQTALDIYEELREDYQSPAHPVYLADLAAAYSIMALSTRQPERLDVAAAYLEGVLGQQNIPVDARIEAGYALGQLYHQRDNQTRAASTFWQMIHQFLPGGETPPELGAQGRYWLARCLLDLADLLVAEGRPQEARKIYELLIHLELPGKRLAATQAAQLAE